MALRPPLKKKHGGPLLIQFLECGKLSNRFPNITINDGLKKTSHKSPTNYGIPWHNILHIPRFVAFGLPRDRHDPIQATNSACICNSKPRLWRCFCSSVSAAVRAAWLAACRSRSYHVGKSIGQIENTQGIPWLGICQICL